MTPRKKIKISVGDVFGELTVIDLVGEPVAVGKEMRPRIKCKCSCGNISHVYGWSLANGSTRACISGIHKITHGNYNKPLYSIWRDMCRRTDITDNSPARIKNYASKGISVCDEWLDFDTFEAWALDNGWADADNVSIEREHTYRDYCPENCVILHDRRPQAQNQSHSKWWVIDGVCYDSSTDAAEQLGLSQTTIRKYCCGRTYESGTYIPPRKNCYAILKYQNGIKVPKPPVQWSVTEEE